MTYTQYYERKELKFDTTSMKHIACSTYYLELCGDRAVYILDGRNNLPTQINDSCTRMKSYKNHDGFKIFRAERFTDNNQVELYSSF